MGFAMGQRQETATKLTNAEGTVEQAYRENLETVAILSALSANFGVKYL